MYLHNILTRSENELINRVFEVQRCEMTKGDFVELVLEDIGCLQLDLTFEKISKMTKTNLKKMVKDGMEKSAFDYFREIQKSHSKARPIVYENFEMQEYLSSQKFSTEYRNLLFRLRTRTVQGIKSDFKGWYDDTLCPFGCNTEDTLKHVIECKVLTEGNQLIKDTIHYEDVFSTELEKQYNVTRNYSNLLEVRNTKLTNLASG